MVNYGWICPKCGRVYAPTQHMCLHCGPGTLGLTGISDSTPPPKEELEKYTNISDPFKYKIDCGPTDWDKAPSMYYNSTKPTCCDAYLGENKLCIGVKEPFVTNCQGNTNNCVVCGGK